METTIGENEKRLLASILKKRLIEGKNTITYKELLEQEMPLFLKNFLQNRVRKYFYTAEPLQFKNTKRYDFNYEKIRVLKQQLHRAFEEATLFSKEEITEIINRTVGLQFDLLIDPHKTLIKIFYRNKSERTQTEILQILNGLIDTRLYIQQLIQAIRDFDHFHIIKDDFDKLAQKTQIEVFKNDFLSAFMSDVNNYVEFVGHIKNKKEKKINKYILISLLKARNYKKYYEAFYSLEDELINIQHVKSQLISFINNNGVDDKINESDEDYLKESIISTSVIEKAEEGQENGDYSYKHFPIIEESVDPHDFIIDKSMIESQPEGPIASLESLIDEKSKKLIQRKIFCKDEIAYSNFILRLEDIDNWKAAKQVIDDELVSRSIEPFSREALTLGDLVFNRYFPQKNN